MSEVTPQPLESAMNDNTKIVQTAHGWFIETDGGRIGPMESQLEAKSYLSLMRIASGAGYETACTEQECLI